MRIVIFNLLIVLVAGICLAQGNKMKSVEQQGMRVSWRVEGDSLHLLLKAPARGWLAIGFNPQAGLENTHLLMAAVEHGQLKLSDRYIIRAGCHQPVEQLGGQSVLKGMHAFESIEQTTIHLRIPLQATDDWHYKLEEGGSYYLLMAYSNSDDFLHHSTMRTSIQIQL